MEVVAAPAWSSVPRTDLGGRTHDDEGRPSPARQGATAQRPYGDAGSETGGGRVRQDLLGHRHALTIRLEARRGATRPRKWRRWSTLDPRAQRLVADSLVMLNLIERDGHPDEVEERPARAEQPGMPLPPCIRTNHEPLQPGMTCGTSMPPAPGSACLPDCKFQLCPYPPRGCVPRGEIREPFCRRQQALLPGRVRRLLPRGPRRKTPHRVGMRVREPDRFWDEMAKRTRD